MRRVCWTILPAFICCHLLSTLSASAQDQPPAQNQNAANKPKQTKDRKNKASKLAKESAPFDTWLGEEVPLHHHKRGTRRLLPSRHERRARAIHRRILAAAQSRSRLSPRIPIAKNTIAASPTPTNGSPLAFRAGKPIADTSTSFGDHLTKSIPIPLAARMIVQPNKAADRPPRIPGNSGATAISKTLATTLRSNLSIRAVPANIT